ncbi:hypothetical protein RB195_018520 [Necator americanus]|uniref:Reverse transcriptase domain-containing protein n=1 Tax=Necator americanus TaxID=51031 RepID=A0ABR1CBS9_NECAM
MHHWDISFPPPLTHHIGKGVRQGDSIPPKLFTGALQWIIKSLLWEEKGVLVDRRFLPNLLFAERIVLFSRSTDEAETMLKELNEARKNIGPRMNRKKTQVKKNAYCEDGGVQLGGSQIVGTSSYVYLRRSMNMENDLKEELNTRMRAAWAAFALVREATDQRRKPRAIYYTRQLSQCYVTKRRPGQTPLPRLGNYSLHRALERCLLKFNRGTQHLAGLRSA